MMKRRGILALFIFTLFCVAIIFGIVFVARQYKEEEMRKKEELEALYDKMYSEALSRAEAYEEKYEAERKEKEYKEKNYSPYERLSDKGMTTHMLYLGGTTLYGVDVNPVTEPFRVLLSSMYEAGFEGETDRKMASSMTEINNAFAYTEKVLFEEYVKGYKLDLLFLCFDSREDNENFAISYESLARGAKEFNEKAEVFCIIQHNQKKEDADAIIKICEHYDFIYVDMRQHFEGREELLTENGYPNVDGHKVYADAIYEELFSAVEEKRPATDLKDDGVFLSSEKIAEIKEKIN
jgi:hemerythrin